MSGTVTGFVSGDTLASATGGTLAWGTTANAASNAGGYAINGGGLTAANYDFVQASSNATALTVNKATLTYTANAASRTYGDANPALSGTVTGFKGSDTLASATGGTLVWGTTANAASNAGGYAITGSGLTAANYDFVQAASNATALTVNKATLTYTANAASRIYGDANPALSGTISGWKNADNQGNATTGTLSWGTTADAASNAGSYAITGSGLTAANYDFMQAGSNATALTVNKATLTVTANAASKTYGTSDPALTYGVNGLVNGDMADGVLSGGLARTAGETVAGGPYAISQGTLNANGNYTINYTGASLTITPRALIVTANNANRYVGQPTPPFSASYSGLAAGDTPASLSGALTFGTSATSSSPAGNYAITLTGTLASPNYTVTYVNGVLTIAGRAINPAYDTAVICADHLAARGSGANGRGGPQAYHGLLMGYLSGVNGPLYTITGHGVNTGGYAALPGLNNFAQSDK